MNIVFDDSTSTIDFNGSKIILNANLVPSTGQFATMDVQEKKLPNLLPFLSFYTSSTGTRTRFLLAEEQVTARTLTTFLKLTMRVSLLCLLVSVTKKSHIFVLGNEEEAVISTQGNVQVHVKADVDRVTYGVDTSWPMHHNSISFDRPNPLGMDTRHYIYKEYMQGCIGDETQKLNYLEECRRWEADRIAMNLQQPAISQNYTHAGYAKVETPSVVRRLLQEVWKQHQDSKVMELWERGNTYLNHWQSPTHMIDIKRILSQADQWDIVNAVQSILEAWTQQSLVLTSIYGIRIYSSNAILSPHVDRLPLVSSVIINVAQDVEEPWVLEVIGHDGKASNVTMDPWDMVLYESHSVIHGRPFPLKGNYYANLFIHFEPLGHSFRHMQNAPQESAQVAFERAKAALSQKQHATDEEIDVERTDTPTGSIPYYIHPDKEVRWRQQFAFEKEAQVGGCWSLELFVSTRLSSYGAFHLLSICPFSQVSPKPTRATLGHINPHFAAADGLLHLLKEIAALDQRQLFKNDHNGWRPLHEAARAGHADVVRYLLKEGAQVNERANDGEGGSPLWWAERKPKENAKTISVLKEHGGVSLAPKVLEPKKVTDVKKTEASVAPLAKEEGDAKE